MQEIFATGQSVIHRTDPRVRVISATIYSFALALADYIPALVFGLCFSITLALAASLPAKPLLKRLTAAGGFLLLIWLVLPVTYAGDPWVRIGPMTISHQGINMCILITLKTMAILIELTALVATIPLSTLGHTLYKLKTPAKLVQLMLLAYRYTFVIEQEYQRLLRAAKMRNFRPATNLHTYKTYAYLLGMLFVRASERAQRVHQAMKCRGFSGRFYTLNSYRATSWNGLLAVAMGVGCVGIVWLNIVKL